MVMVRFRVEYPQGLAGFGFVTQVFRFGAPKPIGFGFEFEFSPMDTPWISVWNKNSWFIVY